MVYCCNIWYSYEDWNDLPLIRRIEKFLHELGLVLTFDEHKRTMVNLVSKFSNDK